MIISNVVEADCNCPNVERLNKRSMSKVYNSAFKVGILFDILLFVLLNIVSYKVALKNFMQESLKAPFYGHFGYSWGFPVEMFQNERLIHPLPLIINAAIYVACGFCFGFLFKFIWAKFQEKSDKKL